MTDAALTVVEPSRPEEVRLQIVQIGHQIHSNFIVLGRLLKEARDGDYHLSWGFQRFGAWVEEASGLDMSERSAYDFIKVIEVAERLQIPDEELSQVKISNLKEIMSLPESTDPELVKELLNEAKTMPVKKVREIVDSLKGEGWTYHTLKFDQETEDNVFQPTLERIRREYGSTMSPCGGPVDISDSRAVEMLCADKLAEPEEEAPPTIEAEFQDVVYTDAA